MKVTEKQSRHQHFQHEEASKSQVKCVLAALDSRFSLSLDAIANVAHHTLTYFHVPQIAYSMRLMAIRILVADDSAVFRGGLRTMLEDHIDWQVCGEAEDGIEAVKKNRLLAPQLVVMDFSMPYMSGIEAAYEILKEFPKVPILLLTLYLTHHVAEKARDLGIRATLSKTDMQHLVGEIEAILQADGLTSAAIRSKESQS